MTRNELRLLAPYEYLDSLNQRQTWAPYLTGRERQEFDTQLRVSFVQVRVDETIAVNMKFPCFGWLIGILHDVCISIFFAFLECWVPEWATIPF